MNPPGSSSPIGWVLRRKEEVPTEDDWLTEAEREVLAGLRVPKRRSDWRLGRWTARHAVGAFLAAEAGAPPLEEIEIRAAADGAPEAYHQGEPLPVTLSLSHREGLGLCVAGPPDVALGCDLEILEERSEAFLADYLTPAEQQAVADAGPGERDLLANLLWSAKESLLKAVRTGLSVDTRKAEVTIPPSDAGTEWNPLTVTYAATGGAFGGWWRAEGAFLTTVVTDSPGAAPVCLDV